MRRHEKAEKAGRRLPGPARLFLGVTLLATAACLLSELICGLLLHLPAPYNWPLTPIREFGFDYLEYLPKYAAFHHPGFFRIEPQYPFNYPAPMAVLQWALHKVFADNVVALAAFIATVALAGAALLTRAAVRKGLPARSAILFWAVTLCCSYPLAFEIKQGNLEIFVWLLVVAGVFTFARGNTRTAALCFALAGALKLFPLCFLGLHLARGKWRSAFAAVGITLAVTVASLWLITGDLAFTWQQLHANAAILQDHVLLRVLPREIGFDHSLFGLLKAAVGGVTASTLRIYLGAAAVSGVLLFVMRIRKQPFPEQVLALTAASILLPPVSYDYTLLYLYLPLGLFFFRLLAERQAGPQTRVILILLALILAPMSEFIVHGQRFGGQIKAVLLAALLTLAVTRNQG